MGPRLDANMVGDFATIASTVRRTGRLRTARQCLVSAVYCVSISAHTQRSRPLSKHRLGQCGRHTLPGGICNHSKALDAALSPRTFNTRTSTVEVQDQIRHYRQGNKCLGLLHPGTRLFLNR